MNNVHPKKDMSRGAFLKTSGMVAAGISPLPASLMSTIKNNSLAGQLYINGIAGYAIVIPAQATAVEQEAASQLQHYLFGMSKVNLPVVAESDYTGKTAIYLGQTRYAKTNKFDFGKLQEDGYAFKPVGKNFVLAGGSGKGVLYGVYGLLETLGFRKYTSDYTKIPTGNAISFPKEDVVDVPFVKYRTTSYRDTRDPEYTNWHHLSSRDNWGLFVHTFDALLSPDEYGKSHPEYFSQINGSREPGTQLCLSNPAVVDVVVANLIKKISANPAPLYWSVSQNDNDQHCQCDNCKALDKKYGDVPSGSMLFFVNKVAKQFPDKIISTLAYWYSRSAPKNIQAEKNVNIMLCNIESKRQAPVYDTDPAFANDLKDWGKLTSNILIWDYNIQFSNLVSPFPNLHTIKPNIKYYTENNVNSLFMQSNSQAGGEMAGLRAYLICKLMWNPEADDKAIIDDYLNGYYGAAGPFIRQYIDQMHDSLINTKFQLSIFGDPIDAKDSYLSVEMLNTYKQLFDKAEQAVAKDAAVLKRVQIARLPIMYAEIQIGRQEVDTPRSLYMHTADGMVALRPVMKTLLTQFVDRCKEEGVTRLRERSTSPDDYLQSYQRIFTKMDEMGSVLSYKKKIIPVTQPGKTSAGVEGLTDGIFGSWESWSNPDAHWIGYEGEHMDFVLDLGAVKTLTSVNMDFLNAQAQPDWNLLVLPKFVSYSTSGDGVAYSEPITVTNPHDPNPKVNPDIATIAVQSFQADLKGVNARYVKVHAESLLKLPAWHIRTGKAAWIYSDEIVVK